MQVTDVLDRITERNPAVVGCIARKGEQLHHNLADFNLDCTKIADTVEDLLAVSDLLEGMDTSADTVLTEYDGNCLVGMRIDGNLLVAVSDHMQRAGFKKLQVGLSLQTRLLTKALDDAPAPDAVNTPTPKAQPQPDEVNPSETARQSTWTRILRAVVAEVPEMSGEAAAPENTEGKTRKMYRGQVYYE